MSRMRKVTWAASLGTAFEWYDFFIYGIAAALIFPVVFFPEGNAQSGLLLSLTVYATGFFARPVGGVLSGWFGDRFGRKRALTVTLLAMGTATFVIGLLPTYATIGVWAPILLVVIRLVQGAAAGGEWGGAALLTMEHTSSRRGYWGGFVASSIFVGLILGNLAFVILQSTMARDDLIAWGWRIPFLFSFIFVGVGRYVRARVTESPEFTRAVAAEGGARTSPLLDVLRNPRNVIAIFLMRLGENTVFYLVSVYFLTYVTTTLKLEGTAIWALLAGAVAAAVLSPVWGAIADRVGYKLFMGCALAFGATVAFPLFLLLDTRVVGLVVLVFVIAVGVAGAAGEAAQPAFFSSMFGTRVRYSGISVGREGGTIIGGGLTPLIAVALYSWAGHWWPVATWMVITSLIAVLGVMIAKPTTDGEPGTAAAAVREHGPKVVAE